MKVFDSILFKKIEQNSSKSWTNDFFLFRSTFFATILLISIILSTISIWLLSQSEMRHSSALQPQPIHNLPFAAVTICPETKAKKSLINFTAAYAAIRSNDSENNLDDDEWVFIHNLSNGAGWLMDLYFLPELFSRSRLKLFYSIDLIFF